MVHYGELEPATNTALFDWSIERDRVNADSYGV